MPPYKKCLMPRCVWFLKVGKKKNSSLHGTKWGRKDTVNTKNLTLRCSPHARMITVCLVAASTAVILGSSCTTVGASLWKVNSELFTKKWHLGAFIWSKWHVWTWTTRLWEMWFKLPGLGKDRMTFLTPGQQRLLTLSTTAECSCCHGLRQSHPKRHWFARQDSHR